MDGQMIVGVVNYPDQLPPTVSHVYQTAGNVGYQYPLKFGKLVGLNLTAQMLMLPQGNYRGRRQRLIKCVVHVGRQD